MQSGDGDLAAFQAEALGGDVAALAEDLEPFRFGQLAQDGALGVGIGGVEPGRAFDPALDGKSRVSGVATGMEDLAAAKAPPSASTSIFENRRPAAPAPPRWKQACVIFLVFFPLSLLVNWASSQAIADWPLPLRVLVSVLVMTPVMTYAALPWITRRMGWWLRPGG